METIVRFKNRETTAKHGKSPREILNFADLDLEKEELDILYEAICYEIGNCSDKQLYNIIEVYINLMLDIEDIIEEIKSKYKSHSEYIFQLPLHILELNYLLKALKNYSLQLKKNDDKNNEKLNLLIEGVTQLIKKNYKEIRYLFTKYDKAKRLYLLKNIWKNLYELTGEE